MNSQKKKLLYSAVQMDFVKLGKPKVE